jgi:hypothetical protein
MQASSHLNVRVLVRASKCVCVFVCVCACGYTNVCKTDRQTDRQTDINVAANIALCMFNPFRSYIGRRPKV